MQVQKVLLTGTNHLRKGLNCQSFVDYATVGEFTFGVIADGCGSGKHNEVSAKLSVNFIMMFLTSVFESNNMNCQLFLNNKDVFAYLLMKNYFDFLKEILLSNTKYLMKDSFEQKQYEFIIDYLLATISIVIIYKNEAVTFHYSDGYEVVDEKTVPLSIKGKRYIAQYIGFDKIPLFDVNIYSNVKRLIVADDGLRFFHNRDVFYIFEDDGFYAQMELEYQLKNTLDFSFFELPDDLAVLSFSWE